jgi:hypothetical protein
MSPSTLRAKLPLWLSLCSSLAFPLPRSCGDDSPSPANPPASSSLQARFVVPDIITAGIYAAESSSAPLLFNFKRTITRDASTLKVLREYNYADGKPAAREHVVYENDAPAFYQLEELQTGDIGSATIKRDPTNPNKGRITFQYIKDASRHPTVSTRTEVLQPDTLINDTVGMFLASHWDSLVRGEKVGCRYIVLGRRETVGFTFRKESETQWRGRDVIVLKMEPTSFLIAALVDPLHFLVEKAPPHRVLQYTGPTAPKLGHPGHWSDLAAVTIFNW